ncbi:MAG TPA: DUF4239 domain-containing protein [Pyrinomonadaceae bacterium]|jgi:hypothetical protein|nr:DUF4239 domain-containing protein [Pyrinomonadaceae bacterium]
MPMWAYNMSPLQLALIMVAAIEAISLFGLYLARRFLLPHLRFHDGVNDAISGTVQAIGVFYGITVGLIAVGVWNTHSNAQDVVSKEAAAIGALYRDVSGYPQPVREKLQTNLKNYTQALIDQIWPAQQEGRMLDVGVRLMDDFQGTLYFYEPTTAGQTALHGETLRAFNNLIAYRRLRIDAVEGSLSAVMWAVIWVGAVISISVAYLYRIEDARIHTMLVGLMAGFLGVVLFMIVINDRPFIGRNSIRPDSYRVILNHLIGLQH